MGRREQELRMGHGGDGEQEDGHGHGHEHGHGGCDHGHGHVRPLPGADREGLAASRRALRIAFFITASFMAVEAIGGLVASSLALLADAGHMLTDAAALGLSVLAFRFAERPATTQKTYGYLRLEILAALFNGVTLVLISLGIFWEAWDRLHDPPRVDVPVMLSIAVLGLVANVAAAVTLHATSGHSLNTRAAYLHVLGDLLGSVGAITAALVIHFTGYMAADPAISIVIGVLILLSAYRVSKQSIDVLLEAVPAHIDFAEVEAALREEPGVADVHDLHVWTLSSGIYLLTVHAVLVDDGEHQEVLVRLGAMIRTRFDIEHTTIQVERAGLVCPQVESGACR